MLIRIVRMHFTETGANEFLTIFNAYKTTIRNFPGCMHLELLSDVHHPTTYTTLSHWESESGLNQYRSSALFEVVWKGVKKHFAKQPEAFSLHRVMEV